MWGGHYQLHTGGQIAFAGNSLWWNFRSGKSVPYSGSTVLWGGMFSAGVDHIKDFVDLCRCHKNDLPLVIIIFY